ncbi:MAG: DUF1932 domain-containing protein [Gammaproteobacteria bacterium]
MRIEQRLAFIGFGEAAQAFTAGWKSEVELEICAYDIKTDQASTRHAKQEDYRRTGVHSASSATDAVSQADVIISAVTADAVLDAAASVLPALTSRQLYVDINSAAPDRKCKAARMIASQGAAYVDVAVMAPVQSGRHRTPLLIGGPGARRIESLFRRLDMNFEVVSDEVGYASTVKMVRSVMVKGLEGLVIECMLAGVAAGVDRHLLISLDSSFPGMEWEKLAGYMLERAITHGRRQAAEMRDVAVTLNDMGLGSSMAAASAERLQWLADMDLGRVFPYGLPDNYLALAETVLARIKQ